MAKKAKKDLFRSPIAKLILLWLLAFLILCGSLLSTFLNLFNYLEVRPSELILPLIMHITTSAIIAAIVYFIPWPKLYSAKLATVFILSFFMVGYNDRLNNVIGFYRSFIPFIYTKANDEPIISIFFLATILCISILVGVLAQKLLINKKQSTNNNLIYLLFILVGVIFISQAFKTATILPSVIKQAKVNPKPLAKQSNSTTTDKPDIYYIVLDRYTNNQVLKEQFAFDNSYFTDYLKGKGFYVKEDACSNYPLTTISISSTLNAAYTKNVVEPYASDNIQSRTLYHNLISQSSVIKSLKNEGYAYLHIGSPYGATNSAPQADDVMVKSNYLTLFNKFHITLNGIEVGQFNQSPYYQFFKFSQGWWPFKDLELDEIEYVKAQIDSLNEIASTKSGGRFILAHILVPHDPFSFNADGSTSAYPYTDTKGKTIKQKYLDQVVFINDQIKQIVTKIDENSSGKAVIVINSDEGAYPHNMNSTNMNPIDATNVLEKGDMTKWSDDWLRMKFGILQAVRVPNVSQQELQEKISSVNVFRIILNNYFNYKLDYLPSCNFATHKGDEFMFNYSDITARLNSQTVDSSYCKNLESK